ncbi:hypothetical protein [Silvibacterium acidisoli]|uniref:hypothetical protein n=1 Tax=Acidobacteriaceae bacterium ZG23-2 TaxID=2883246 RepID=UPI00406D4CD8
MLRKLLFLAAVPMLAQQASNVIQMPSDRVGDSYAIFSSLLPGKPFDTLSPEQYPQWAIADTTVSIADMSPAVPPQGQLKPPPDNPSAFNQALQDYEARKYQRVQLMPIFHVTHQYDLITDSQVKDLRTAKASVTADSALQSKYRGYPGVTFFSQVFYNGPHTAALVYMNNWCNELCNGGEWVYLEKHGGQWVRRSGVNVPGA